MNDHYVINLGRQLGSGGKEIGEKLAKALNIAFFDSTDEPLQMMKSSPTTPTPICTGACRLLFIEPFFSFDAPSISQLSPMRTFLIYPASAIVTSSPMVPTEDLTPSTYTSIMFSSLFINSGLSLYRVIRYAV